MSGIWGSQSQIQVTSENISKKVIKKVRKVIGWLLRSFINRSLLFFKENVDYSN